MNRRTSLLLLVAFLVLLAVSSLADKSSQDDLDAEEEAARLVGEQAELEADEDISDALDEEVDAARGTIEDPNKHPLSDMSPPSTDVDVATVVRGLDEDGVTMEVGKEYTALVGFANGGRTSYHVWGAMGSLNFAEKWNVYVQNFTYQIINRTVEAGQELSLGYRFTPNERLDTRDYRMALSLFYEARNTAGEAVRSHSSTFFNQTVKAVAGPAKVNTTSIALTMTLLAILGAGGFFGYKNFAEAEKGKEGVSTETQGSEDDWLAEHHNMIGSRARSRSMSPGRASRKK